ncbi:hypothetical protein F5X68DRAFT_203931 [Plectosphaerella plurivora]|uniref:Proteolipid membrane potential modulator n=1 Tax=Plectosphaerella plurivora TaxID=936078 RepID=A0A9P8VEX6_9PEZI|nr:hypothetical protein F5X68DRAFT_203931 [Plectosphaerella plurivora]
MSGVAALLIVLITLFVPPIGVLAVAGCGMDFIVNILLTILGFIPGLIHGLYVLYIYYDRRDQIAQGRPATRRAPGIYSDKVQSGGGAGYGTMR